MTSPALAACAAQLPLLFPLYSPPLRKSSPRQCRSQLLCTVSARPASRELQAAAQRSAGQLRTLRPQAPSHLEQRVCSPRLSSRRIPSACPQYHFILVPWGASTDNFGFFFFIPLAELVFKSRRCISEIVLNFMPSHPLALPVSGDSAPSTAHPPPTCSVLPPPIYNLPAHDTPISDPVNRHHEADHLYNNLRWFSRCLTHTRAPDSPASSAQNFLTLDLLNSQLFFKAYYVQASNSPSQAFSELLQSVGVPPSHHLSGLLHRLHDLLPLLPILLAVCGAGV